MQWHFSAMTPVLINDFQKFEVLILQCEIKPTRRLFMAIELRPHPYQKNNVLIAVYFKQPFTDQQIITAPLNPDHRASYHQSDICIYAIEAVCRCSCPFLSKH